MYYIQVSLTVISFISMVSLIIFMPLIGLRITQGKMTSTEAMGKSFIAALTSFWCETQQVDAFQ